MFGVAISHVHSGRGLFCYSNLNFSILTIKRKQISLLKAVTQIFNYS